MRMKAWLSIVAAAAVLLIGTAAWGQDFYVVAGGGPPVGTKITSLPAGGLNIGKPGFYFLCGTLNYSGTNPAITIGIDGVTLDLMGFSLTGPGGSGAPDGIFMSARSNVEVRNGTVQGFAIGVREADSNNNGNKHRIINVRAINNVTGIWLFGKNHLIKNCSASNNSTYGLCIGGSGQIIDSEANNNDIGIVMDGPGSVLGNTALNNTSLNFFLGHGVATSILVDRNSAFGLSPNYAIWDGTPSGNVLITANNSGTP